MDEARARAMFEVARREVGASLYEPLTFEDVDEQAFLREYCWVVFASGFRYAVVRDKFPGIEAVFHGFDPAGLAAMERVDLESLPIRNRRKADGFLNGSRRIAAEGFNTFKERLARHGGVDVLEELPGIGPVTKHHLAKNIGLSDTAKPDVWLVRCADACDATVEELTSYLADAFAPIKRHNVDTILWDYCQQFQDIPDGGPRPLTAGDLAAAVAYRTTVEAGLLAVLDAVRDACGLPATRRNPWQCDKHLLYYQTPWTNDGYFYEFGFDFDRQDEQWSVAGLGLPSAYCAVVGGTDGDTDGFDWSFLPEGWVEPPDDGWTEGTLRVKRLDGIRVKGESLADEYLEFLRTAVGELKELMDSD